MATRYWVGGSGTWDTSSTTHWSASTGGAAGASAPVAGDTVFFDSSSSSGSYAVTCTSTISRTAATTINGPASGTLTFTLGAAFSSSGALTIGNTAQLVVFDTSTSNYTVGSGNLTIGSGGTLTCNGSTINCAITSIFGTMNAGSSTFQGTGTLTIGSGSGGILNAGSSTMSVGTATTGITFNIFSGGTLNGGTASISTTSTFSVAGSIATGSHSISCKVFSVTSTGTVSAGGSITCTLASTTALSVSGGLNGVGTITCNGTNANITISGTGSLSAVTSVSTLGTVSLSGSLTANSSTISSGGLFAVLNGGLLTGGSSNITCGGFSLSTGGTVSAGTSTITTTKNFIGNGGTYYAVVFSPATTTSASLTGNNTFTNLTVTGNTLTATSSGTPYGVLLASGSSQTVTGTFRITSGTNITYRTFVGISPNQTNIPATGATLNCAAVSLTNADFYGVTLTGAAAPASGTNLGNIGSNTGITFSSSKTVYWNLAGTQPWSATAWATSSGGTPALANYPLAQDNVVFDDAGAAGTVQLYTSYFVSSLSLSGRTTAITINNALSGSRLYVGGNLIALGSIANISSDIYAINSTNKNVSGTSPNLSFNLFNQSSLTLQSNLTVGIFSPSIGSVSTNLNGFTLTGDMSGVNWGGALTFNGGTLVANTGGLQPDPTSTFVSGTSQGTIRFTGSSSGFLYGNGINYDCTIEYALTGALDFTIYNSATINNITNSTIAGYVIFSSGNTYTFNNFNLKGSPFLTLYIISDVTGNQFTLLKTSGAVSSNYLSIQDSIATGGAVWYAGNNSVDLGNNSGWLFKSFSSGAMALFLP